VSDRELIERIGELKRRRNAVILVHNYQPAEVQALADFLGDSLDLSRKAAEASAETIVFCGVRFMAETAAILSPDKTVLLPDSSAGCPMADMITAEQLRALRKQHPGTVVVAYVNSSAAVKAEADLCCTSANAAAVVQSIPEEQEVIFVPDRCLGGWAMKVSGRRLILYPGWCPVHQKLSAAEIALARELYPGAWVMVHPECIAEVTAEADEVLSTSGMVRAAGESGREEFIVGTEVDMLTRLRRDYPAKKFYPASSRLVCPDMKKITPEKVLQSLEENCHRIIVPEEIRRRALKAVEAMVAIS
jgi:quinolinate synthase